jgi:hypothetical protein
MRAGLLALLFGTLLTVEQRDDRHHPADQPSTMVSANGCCVAFVAYAQLVQADTDTLSDLYVLDRRDGVVRLESPNLDGHGSASVYHPGISGDGRLVVYQWGDEIILRDRQENVSKPLAHGRHPAISRDGSTVVFTAGSLPQVPGVDANGTAEDIYAMTVGGGEVQRISVGLPHAETSVSFSPSVSADGRVVAFTRRVFTEPGKTPPSQIVVHDTRLGVSRIIGSGWDPALSGDGTQVVFVRMERGLPQVFLASVNGTGTQIVSRSARGGFTNGASTNPAISADGRFVAFQSEASNLVDDEDFNLLWDVFVRDLAGSVTTRLSGDSDGIWMEPSSGPSIDAAGHVIAFSSKHPTDIADKKNDFDLYVAIAGAGSGVAPVMFPAPFNRAFDQKMYLSDICMRRSLRADVTLPKFVSVCAPVVGLNMGVVSTSWNDNWSNRL